MTLVPIVHNGFSIYSRLFTSLLSRILSVEQQYFTHISLVLIVSLVSAFMLVCPRCPVVEYLL